jgi:hypothetical protein
MDSSHTHVPYPMQQSRLCKVDAEDALKLSDCGSAVGVVDGGHAEFGGWCEVGGNVVYEHAGAGR